LDLLAVAHRLAVGATKPESLGHVRPALRGRHVLPRAAVGRPGGIVGGDGGSAFSQEGLSRDLQQVDYTPAARCRVVGGANAVPDEVTLSAMRLTRFIDHQGQIHYGVDLGDGRADVLDAS